MYGPFTYQYPSLGVSTALPAASVGPAAAAGAGATPWMPVVGAGIGALASLVSGLFGAKAQREQQKRQLLYDAETKKLDNQRAAAQTMVAGNQNAFAQMMDAYRSALL